MQSSAYGLRSTVKPTPKLLAIVGPTASGKSALGMELAQKFEGEIICADSRTVYRYMDIGTAKPSNADMLQIKHHLLNLITPEEHLSAAQFKQLAVATIETIQGRGKLPIMVGGSGLYIDSVLFDYQFPGGVNYELRITNQGKTLEELVAELRELDAGAVEGIDIKNRRRVQRAIETAGQPRSKSSAIRQHTLVLGLSVNKKVLQQRIEHRVEKMLTQGLIDEVKELGNKFGWDHEAMRAPAYRAFKQVVLGTKTINQAKADFVRADLQLAKKQLTWFKRNPHIRWLDNPAQAESLVRDFLAD